MHRIMNEKMSRQRQGGRERIENKVNKSEKLFVFPDSVFPDFLDSFFFPDFVLVIGQNTEMSTPIMVQLPKLLEMNLCKRILMRAQRRATHGRETLLRKTR
jgi:hypothetical protein